jgi:hypothetical protein
MRSSLEEVVKLRKEWGGRLLYDATASEMAISGKYVDWLEEQVIQSRCVVKQKSRSSSSAPSKHSSKSLYE